MTVTGICYCLTVPALVVLSVRDWQSFEIPEECTAFIFLVALVHLAACRDRWTDLIAGMFSVSSVLFLIALLTGGKAMGGGDIKLMAAAGLLLGWERCVLAFAVACIAGSVIHVGLMVAAGKGRMLAFGPYLSGGIVFAMIWGDRVIRWYGLAAGCGLGR